MMGKANKTSDSSADEAAGDKRSSDTATSISARNDAVVATDKKSSSQRSAVKASTSSRPSLQRSNSSINKSLRDLRSSLRRQSSQSFRMLKRQSSSFFESVNQNLPTSPSGWALFTLSAASIGLQYELHLQKELTAPPIVFCQTSSDSSGAGGGRNGVVLSEKMDRIFAKLSKKGASPSDVNANDETNDSTNNEDEGIFSRTVTPSLFIGTRGLISSTAAYALGREDGRERRVKSVREVMKMGADGALIVLDWEIPLSSSNDNSRNIMSQQEHTIDIKKANSIDKPVIILLHGLNNDSSFGYIKSMMRTATDRGWIAVCMNFRGQDALHQVKINTPRAYNAGYTGDLRGVIQQIEYRLKRKEKGLEEEEDDDIYVGGPIFLLGYSLGANVVTKYLGEESLHGTLPKCIGGGAAMGNPLHIHSGCIAFPWNMLLGAGVKRSILQNFSSFKQHHEPGYQHSIKRALLSPTIGRLDDAAAPYLIRNDSHPPYTPRIGFKDGEEYWWDSSSHRYVGHVSVPLLKISAQDDFLVFGQFSRKLNHCLENPNVVVVKTRCGGHLGWQESPPPPPKRKSSSDKQRKGGSSGSWSDVAVADFIEALLQIKEEDRKRRLSDDEKRKKVTVSSSAPPPMPKVLSRL